MDITEASYVEPLININNSPSLGSNITASWLGNSFGGGEKWVQLAINDISVSREGKVYANSIWDEAGREIGIYKDGDVIGKAQQTHGWGVTGGLAITTSDNYLYAGMCQSRVSAHDSKPYEDNPRPGEVWYIVRRYDLTGRPAPFVGGSGSDSSMLIVGTTDYITGLEIHEDKLYVSDSVNDLLRVYDEKTMTLLNSFNVPNPGALTIDAQDNLWVIDQEAGDVLEYSLDGLYLNKKIELDDPTDLTVDSQGRLLLVAENGPRQQVLIYNINENEPQYSLNQPIDSLGEEGGIYGGNNPGLISANKFYGLSGVDIDAQGNIYVSLNGFNNSGAILRKYDANKNLQWQLSGLEFLDTADVDPQSDGLDVYTKDEHFVINYSELQGQEAAYHAYTLDPFQYPDDPRLHTTPKGIFIRRIEVEGLAGKQKFMFLTDMYSERLLIYRFEGEIAVPAGIMAKRSTQSWPTSQPSNGMWLWIDHDGDGRIETQEYQTLTNNNENIWGWEVDNNGNILVASETNGLWRYDFQGLNSHGVPLYNKNASQHIQMPDAFTSIQRLEYSVERDTMYLGGYTRELPQTKSSSQGEWGMVGTEVIAYNNWSIEPQLQWRIQLPYNLSTNPWDFIKAMDIAGDRLFAVSSRKAEVFVYDIITGNYLTKITPLESGWVDFPQAIRAYKRNNGEYLVFVEENAKAKIRFYRGNL